MILFFNIYTFIFNATNQTVLFIISVELTTDVALGMTLVIVTFLVFILSLILFPMLNQLGNAGFFFFFAGMCAAGFFYILIFVGETKDLLDKDKKE